MNFEPSEIWSFVASYAPFASSGAIALEYARTIAVVATVLAIFALWRGLVRARRRNLVLGSELARLQMQILGIERLQYEADRKATRDEARLVQLERAARRATAGFGRPDHTLAVAMVRGGAGARALVDCGLSHAESHLMRALNARPNGSRREIESCVISSGDGR